MSRVCSNFSVGILSLVHEENINVVMLATIKVRNKLLRLRLFFTVFMINKY